MMIQSKPSGSLIGKISSYLQIVSKDPHSTAFVPLAEAYRQIGLLDDALEAARLGTGMLPHFSPGFATLGRILGQMGRIDEAMSAFARALSIDRQSQAALTGLARLHLIRGEREQARKILLQAAEFHPEDEMVENMLLALDLPRPWQTTQDVSATAAKAPPTVPPPVDETDEAKPIPTATIAEIYVRQGMTDQAVRVYEEILRIEPGNPEAAHRLAELRGEPVRSLAQTEAPTAETEAPAETPPVPEQCTPLEMLERWLQAIQTRRVHVQ